MHLVTDCLLALRCEFVRPLLLGLSLEEDVQMILGNI